MTSTEIREATTGDQRAEFAYPISEIVTCMRISATMLEWAEGGMDKNLIGQARLLRAAADDLARRGE